MKDLLVAVLSLCALAVVALGGWWVLTESELFADSAAEADPAETAGAFAAAWERGDAESLAELAREDDDTVRATYEQFAEGLMADSDALEVRPGPTEQVQDGRARTPVAVTVDGPFGEVSWDVELETVRERGAWGVVWSTATVHPSLRPGMVFDVVREEVDRAPILAVGGQELAGEREQVTVGFEPGTVADRDELVATFEEVLPDTGEIVERLYARGGLVDDWFYPVISLPAEQADEVRAALRGVRGVVLRSGTGRALYDAGFAHHVVGVVGPVTAEQLERLGPSYASGDEVGQFGLEAVYESDLVDAVRIRAVLRERAEGAVHEVLGEALAGGLDAVRTTLDVPVQQAVENALAGVEDEAAIVVVDAADGAIRAAASRPLTAYNRAFEGRYAPGSAFRLVTGEALLAAGNVPGSEVVCDERTTVGGRTVTNAEGPALGTTSLQQAFAAGCDTTLATLAADALGPEGLAAAAERFGVGTQPQLPVPSFGGSFPTPADTTELVEAAVGLGRVEVSPLQLASMAAAARSGVWHPPSLMVDDEPDEARQLAAGTLDDLRTLLRAAVTDGDAVAAAGAAGDGATGELVEGVAGTARTSGGERHAWFAGSWGQYGFAVLVEDGGSGAEVAAPIAGRLVDEFELQLAADG
ncbi:penicillin-binding transpeptidase domain-containing protein [Egicoccus halophilus]|uniref:penicillin-binding transpeptidase domain-containing protein n=1 Tax=Egicoccus halophilus TaxID=1670830 RepID=UPI0013EE8CF2|nr:penicillin-binding transpeptidase domain-containing protein [Egicoccus halophilus]